MANFFNIALKFIKFYPAMGFTLEHLYTKYQDNIIIFREAVPKKHRVRVGVFWVQAENCYRAGSGKILHCYSSKNSNLRLVKPPRITKYCGNPSSTRMNISTYLYISTSEDLPIFPQKIAVYGVMIIISTYLIRIVIYPY